MAKRAKMYPDMTLIGPSVMCWRSTPTIGPKREGAPYSSRGEPDHLLLIRPRCTRPYINTNCTWVRNQTISRTFCVEPPSVPLWIPLGSPCRLHFEGGGTCRHSNAQVKQWFDMRCNLSSEKSIPLLVH